MCECNKKHQTGYRCPCECHEVIDRSIVEREHLIWESLLE